MDPIAQFKEGAKQAWSTFAPLEMITGSVAPRLVKYAGVERGREVLDVGCGTGVVALTTARLGAKVTGVDLTPELLARARENGAIMGLDVAWQEGDAEALPFADAKFDIVVSQFGHMFAPRPDVAIAQMLRVLKPGGTIAFATWPPELFTGRWFALMGRYVPPLPAGVSPPPQWGDPNIVRERLGGAVRDVTFTRDTIFFPVLSVAHYRRFMEESFGPARKLLAQLDTTEPTKAAQLRQEIEALAAEYFDDNQLRQDFLLTRAIKVGA